MGQRAPSLPGSFCLPYKTRSFLELEVRMCFLAEADAASAATAAHHSDGKVFFHSALQCTAQFRSSREPEEGWSQEHSCLLSPYCHNQYTKVSMRPLDIIFHHGCTKEMAAQQQVSRKIIKQSLKEFENCLPANAIVPVDMFCLA